MTRSEKLAGLVDHYMIHYGHKTRKTAIKAISQDLKNGLDLAPDERVALQYSVKN